MDSSNVDLGTHFPMGPFTLMSFGFQPDFTLLSLLKKQAWLVSPFSQNCILETGEISKALRNNS